MKRHYKTIILILLVIIIFTVLFIMLINEEKVADTNHSIKTLILLITFVLSISYLTTHLSQEEEIIEKAIVGERRMNCPICNNNARKVVKIKKYTILKCVTCKHLFCQPLPSIKELESYYKGFLEVKEETVSVEDAVRTIRKYSEGKKLLDYGGGLGFQAESFRKKGFETTLYDLDSQSCDFAGKRFPKIKVINEYERIPKNHYDMVFSSNVIEHTRKPKEFIGEISNCCKENGLIIIITPNSKEREWIYRPLFVYKYMQTRKLFVLINRFWLWINNNWSMVDPPRHLHGFNNKSIRKVLEEFEIIEIFSEYGIQRSFYNIAKFRINFKVKKPTDVLRIIYELQVYLFSLIAIIIDRRNIYGRDLITIARKNKTLPLEEEEDE